MFVGFFVLFCFLSLGSVKRFFKGKSLSLNVTRLVVNHRLLEGSILYLRVHGVGRTRQITREKPRCRHFMGYLYRLAARDLLYEPFHLPPLCYTGWNGK